MKLHTLKTMMLSGFMEAIIESKIENIVIDGDLDAIQLQEAWSGMISEYYSLMGDGNYKRFLSTSGRIEDKKAKLYCIISTVNFLLDMTDFSLYSPKLLADLEKWGYVVKFENEQQYIDDLEMIFTKMKREERQLKEWISEMELETKNTSKITDEHFGDVLGAIADILKIVIEPTKTSVWSYIFMVKRLNKTYKQTAKNNGRT